MAESAASVSEIIKYINAISGPLTIVDLEQVTKLLAAFAESRERAGMLKAAKINCIWCASDTGVRNPEPELISGAWMHRIIAPYWLNDVSECTSSAIRAAMSATEVK